MEFKTKSEQLKLKSFTICLRKDLKAEGKTLAEAKERLKVFSICISKLKLIGNFNKEMFFTLLIIWKAKKMMIM
jgi:hypothetical protein